MASRLQPSELAKIALPLFVCRLIHYRRDRLGHWFTGTVPLLLPIFVTVYAIYYFGLWLDRFSSELVHAVAPELPYVPGRPVVHHRVSETR